jgi:glycosyltransferase involved in cell wall biosynthesis
MNPIYIVLAGCYWRLICRPVTLWYTHRQVDWKLRLATFWATQIFTAAPESFRLASAKVKVLGHGIDTAAFSCPSRQDNKIKVITHVGRLTAIKHCETLILAAKYLQAKLGPSFVVRFVGGAATTLDQAYVKKLQQLVSDEHLEAVVEFSGPVSNQQIPAIYCASDLSVNLTPTGGLDKSVLESMAAAVPVLSSNQAFRPYFGSWAERLLFPVAGAEILATKIEALLGSTDLASIGQGLQGIARGRSDVKVLIDKMVKFL